MPAHTDVVAQLVADHFPEELADAVLDDDHFARLVDVCSGISDGEPGTLSLVLGEVAEQLDTPARYAALDGPSPAVALADRIRAHYDTVWLRR